MVIALFPMRAQPPHIGHILTIVRLYDKYDKLIIHIADNPGKHYKPEHYIIPPIESVKVFKEVFKYMPKVEVILGKQHIRDRTSFDDLPPFDIILTGNEQFIKDMKGDKPVLFIPRSKIYGFDISGTVLRKLMKNE